MGRSDYSNLDQWRISLYEAIPHKRQKGLSTVIVSSHSATINIFDELNKCEKISSGLDVASAF